MFIKQVLSVLFYFQVVHLQTVPFRFRIVTWNVGNSQPQCDTFKILAFGLASNNTKPDLIVFGFQEATNAILSTYSFHETLQECLENEDYVEIISDHLGWSLVKPIRLYIYVLKKTMESDRVNSLNDNKEAILKVYPDKAFAGVVGYKGVIASRIEIDKQINLMFINMHLPAGEGKSEQRCQLWSRFLEQYADMDNNDDDYVFAFGDQNWRTLNILAVEDIVKSIAKKDYQTILDNDELIQLHRNTGTETSVDCFSNFHEAPIKFPPTYKYIPGRDEYQTEKDDEERRPSYTDRVLVSPMSKNVQIVRYLAINDIKLSDHRPVFADIILQQQTTDNKTPAKFNPNKNLPPKAKTKTSSKKKSGILIIMIIIIAVMCILAIAAVYYFFIKRQRKDDNDGDNIQRSSSNIEFTS